MATKTKGLQKFTKLEIKIQALFKLDKIAPADIEDFTNEERDVLGNIIATRLNTLKGREFDKLVEQTDEITTDDSRNELWSYNHNRITAAISRLMQQTGRMPSQGDISEETGISRQTIHKHLKSYATSPEYADIKRQFQLMSSKVLARVYDFAVNGDVKAAKLYFQVVGNMDAQPSSNTHIRNQNNYIQVNGMVFSQEQLQQLKPEQLQSIEAIIKNALPEANQEILITK